MSTYFKRQPESNKGYALLLVLLASLVIGTGMMATATRAWVAYKGAGRQSQSRAAREVAEAGLSELIERLNRDHAHLLVVNNSKWDNPPYFSSVCSNSSSGVPATTGTIGSRGHYELESYTYNGTPFYGGKADLRMRGEIRNGERIQAAAIVLQTIEIKPKSCTVPYGEPTNTSGFPGLLGHDITLAGNDVLGRMSGNVFCLGCSSEEDIGANTRAIIGGDIFVGPLDMPAAPRAPSNLNLYANPFNCTNCGDIEIISGSSDPDKSLNGQCKKDEDGITHCVVEKLILNNKELKINSALGPVRIYFTGTGEVFKSTGNGGIRHEPSSAPSSNLSLIGNEVDDFDNNDQQFTLRGASDSNNLWAYFPDGHLGIAGGAQDNAHCETLSDGSLGECTGGDIYGAVWAKSWGQTNGASSSTGVQIVVPPDMGQQLYNNWGPDFAIGLRDYVALGVSKWSSFVVDSSRSSP